MKQSKNFKGKMLGQILLELMVINQRQLDEALKIQAAEESLKNKSRKLI